jgi:glycosyltransferase involved in cell wall biosynthesis
VPEPDEQQARRPTIVCVTPVRNEAWTIERFLEAALTWADLVIVADQASTDGTRDLAGRYERVVVIENPGPAYDEGARQRLLLEAARRHVPGPRVVVALDADEALTPPWLAEAEWSRVLAAPPGTTFALRWINVLRDWRTAWVPPDPIPFVFVDDGGEHRGETIHSTRVPVRDPAAVVALEALGNLHFQHTAWERMKAKQRWYQAWEHLEHPRKRPTQLYRQYHRMDAFPRSELRHVDHRWLAAYADRGVDLRRTRSENVLWWDRDVLGWLQEHGAERFRRIDVWDADWASIARSVGADAVADPRTRLDKVAFRFLAATQRRDPGARATRWAQRAMRIAGW